LAARAGGWLSANAVATAMAKGIARLRSENMGRRLIKCLPAGGAYPPQTSSRFSGHFLDDFCPQAS
jgi:hypothetical protein